MEPMVMPAIAPGESPELDSSTISVVWTDSVELVIMVGIMVVLDAPSVVVLDTSAEAVVSGAMLVDEMFCPPHRNTDRKIKKG